MFSVHQADDSVDVRYWQEILHNVRDEDYVFFVVSNQIFSAVCHILAQVEKISGDHESIVFRTLAAYFKLEKNLR